ncbi:IPT/TIG domain-containing protein [Mucilaginibacter gossypiicola]|uniref:IPT/TIG domain-containing protein n=1 Tax=Mucilaginibacter gossypiicola TaxID=551995 RepID=A0A1H8RET5_9SPHI|nr:FG-GAP-like repeat-containing protein [Mucilaginibacter gossypiicola]SEO65049.1 IPT/TIG domain-containing protein [Mucilaginibacter gossypiicola]
MIKNLLSTIIAFAYALTAYAQAPVISSFSPSSGPIGATVTIKGSNFSPIATNNIVHFGGVKAIVASATVNAITVKVPGGSTYEPISVTANNATAYSKKPFDVTFIDGNTVFSPTSFNPFVDLKLGSNTAQYPRKTLLTDFDQDGKPDLIVNEFTNNAIYISKNVQSGTSAPFVSPATLTLTTDAGPRDFANADFDGDGLIDVAVLNLDANTINLFKNTSVTGNLSFAPKTNLATVNKPYFLTVSDIDNDGKPDLVVTSITSTAISVYKNISDNTGIKFAPKIDYTSIQTNNTSMADMDGDGLPDMVIGSRTPSKISIRKNTTVGGNISFATAVDFAFDAGYSSTVADIDNDGKPDLLLGSTYGGVQIYLNTTPNAGSFSFASKVSVPLVLVNQDLYNVDYLKTNSTPSSINLLGVAMNDLDGDGLGDIVLRYSSLYNNINTNLVSVLRNLSTPGVVKFGTNEEYSLYSPQSVCIADIDGDGRPDMVAGTDQTGLAGYRINKVIEPVLTGYKTTDGVHVTINGTNLLKTSALSIAGKPITSYSINSATSISAVVAANTSGIISVTTPYGNATLSGFTNVLTPVISSFSPTSGPIGTTVIIKGANFNSSPGANQVFFGSLKATVTAASPTSLTVKVPYGSLNYPISVTNNGVTGYSAIAFNTTFPGNGGKFRSSLFAAKQDVTVGYAHVQAITTADFDGDGYLDAVFPENIYSLNTSIYVFKNSGNKQTPFQGGTPLRLIGGTNIYDITAADFDGDGKPDIATADKYLDNVSVFKNTSTAGALSFSAKSSFATNFNVTNLYTGDLDGDGKPDIVTTGSNQDGLVSVLKNTTSNGVISFAHKLDFQSLNSVQSIVMTDMDGDGKTDIVASSSNAICILRNTSVRGAISFDPVKIITVRGAQTGITFADFDSDGKPDVAVMTGANAFSVLRNISTIGNISFGNPVINILPESTFAQYLAANDLDGDGKPDLMISNGNNGSSVSALKNISTGTNILFDTRVTYATGLHSQEITSGDFNNDGKPDIAVAVDGANGFSLLINQSNEPQLYTYKVVKGDNTKNVVITGSNLLGTTALNIAGETITSYTVVSDTVITAISALKAIGTITATTSFGTATLKDFSPPPAITSYSVAATTPYPTVTINGSFLTGATAVKFGGVAARSYTVNSALKITAIANSATLGDIDVTTPYGTGTFIYAGSIPAITSFTPATAGSGQTVTITGTNLAGVTSVSFGGVAAASFTVNSATSITAVTGSGKSGDITIITPSGTAAKSGFTYNSTSSTPTITSFTPTTAGSKQTVTITGTNFTGATAVTFGGVAASSFTVNSATSVTAVLASGASGNIVITTPGGTATATGFVFIQAPSIASFTPTAAGSKQTVTIIGTNFTGANAVTFGGVAASSFTVNSATSITAVVALGASGDIVITTPGGTATANGFVFTLAPSIVSFTPSTAGSKQTVTVTGTNFTGATSVTFGGVAASSFTINSATSVTAVVASGASGNIVITTPGGTATATGFVFIPVPSIASFTPTAAGSKQTVTITGTNFTGATAVTFGGVAASSFTVNSATSVTAVVASGASGDIVITTPGGTATATGFVFIPAPSIASFTPSTAGGKQTVTITGTNFTGATSVTFGGVEASSFTVNSATSVTAIVASGASGDIVITTPGGTATANGFVFTLAPSIVSFTPTTAGSKQTVTITGTNFTGATAVTFGGVAASSFTVNSATSVTAVVASGASGNIVITTPGGIATATGFVFIPGPSIASFTPTAAGSKQTVTITGTNLTGATAVTFGGVAASSFTVNSSTSVTAVVASGTSGDISVTIGNRTVSISGFTFVPTPVITASGPTTILTTQKLTLTASPGSGYNYQWMKDGVAISGANSPSYSTNSGGSYTVAVSLNGVVSLSAPLVVNATFALPATNFTVQIISAACKGSANGSVIVKAAQNFNYTATITAANITTTSYSFTSSAQINNLSAGSYNVCITVAGQPDYSQCFTVVVTEPQDLSVYVTNINSNNQVTLNLSGSSSYTVNLNGAYYTTSENEITLQLAKGKNTLLVSTEKACQGIVQKDIVVDNDVPYPNPFSDHISINLGPDVIKSLNVRITDTFGKQVYSAGYTNKSGTLTVNLPDLKTGIYLFNFSADNLNKVFKILKK